LTKISEVLYYAGAGRSTPYGYPWLHTCAHLPTRVNAHAGTRMSMSRASASATGTLDKHVQVGTHARNKAAALVQTNCTSCTEQMYQSHTSVEILSNKAY
jgi:hypothetical protein